MTERKIVSIILTPEEHRELLQRAEHDGIDAVEWVRRSMGVYARFRDAGLRVTATR